MLQYFFSCYNSDWKCFRIISILAKLLIIVKQHWRHHKASETEQPNIAFRSQTHLCIWESTNKQKNSNDQIMSKLKRWVELFFLPVVEYHTLLNYLGASWKEKHRICKADETPPPVTSAPRGPRRADRVAPGGLEVDCCGRNYITGFSLGIQIQFKQGFPGQRDDTQIQLSHLPWWQPSWKGL